MVPEFLKPFIIKGERLPDELYGFVDVYTFEIPNLKTRKCRLIVGREPLPVTVGWVHYIFRIRTEDRLFSAKECFDKRTPKDWISGALEHKFRHLVLGVLGLEKLP